MPRGRPPETCRHDVTPSSKCKLCRNEADRMRRRSKNPNYIPRRHKNGQNLVSVHSQTEQKTTEN
jgi:hypothetical protein